MTAQNVKEKKPGMNLVQHAACALLGIGAVAGVRYLMGRPPAGSASWWPLLTTIVTLLTIAVVSGLLLFILYLRTRMNQAEKDALAQVNGLGIDEARSAALAAIEETGYFVTVPASQPVDQSWPESLRDLFDRYDRLEFTLAEGRPPFMVLERTAVRRLDNCADAFGAGTFGSSAIVAAVDTATSRAFLPARNGSPKRNNGTVTHKGLSYQSIWHMMNYLVTRRRIVQLRREGRRLGTSAA